MLGRIARQYWGEGSTARRFFLRNLWRGLRQSPRLIAQTVIYMGMYLHFCKVHGQTLPWDPWQSAALRAAALGSQLSALTADSADS
jgi:hypothetical protein